jgi:hypothetical protein
MMIQPLVTKTGCCLVTLFFEPLAALLWSAF